MCIIYDLIGLLSVVMDGGGGELVILIIVMYDDDKWLVCTH